MDSDSLIFGIECLYMGRTVYIIDKVDESTLEVISLTGRHIIVKLIDLVILKGKQKVITECDPNRKEKILSFIRNNPELTNTQISLKFSIERTTVKNYRKQL